MTALEQLTRATARTIIRNGVPVLSTKGDPALLAAFAELGWDDPHEDADVAPESVFEAATVEAPEHAVLDRPIGHLG